MTDPQAELLARARGIVRKYIKLGVKFVVGPNVYAEWMQKDIAAALQSEREAAYQRAMEVPFTKALVAEAREAAAAEARRAAIEECALILKGRVYKHRYREYPALDGDGNWSGDSAFVRHCDKFAEAILALASPTPQEETR